MLCIWKFTQSKYKAPFSIWQWKKNCKTFNLFLNVIYFDAFFVIHVLHVIFYFFFLFFFPLFLMLECSQVGGVRETEAHNRTGRRQLALLHTRVAVGVGGGWGVGGWRSEPKTKEDMYNHLCGQETERQPSDGLWCLPMPHTLAAFLLDFSFISLNIQIIRTILSCQIKKIYRGSLGFFSTTKKRYGKYL